MALKLNKWNTLDYLKTDEDRAAYLEACFDEAGDDPIFIAKALDNIAKAKGMNDLMLDKVEPSFSSILKAMKALGIRLHAEAVTH
ncbi:MAG: transcriptional regulator [Methylococcaceae bacterium]|nr:transcriptional regulator [Methylococcaceae bacterium]